MVSSHPRPEPLTIRPPSEWRSLLLRSTRGCNWNRCKFCGVYPALGEPEFSMRPLDDIKSDIDWYAARMPDLTTAFIGDADPLCRPIDESVTLLTYLKERLPHLSRITAYARAGTLYRLGIEGLRRLAAAGLTRVHTGLESGDLATLKFHCKGQSPKMVIDATRWTKAAGIEVSFYILLGLGGRDRWKEHIDGTAAVVNATDPEFIRLRRIWLFTPESSQTATACPLWADIQSGTFAQQTPEGTVLELRRLIEKISGMTSRLVCDHANNYLTVEGDFPGDKERMLAEIDAFLALPKEEREQHYRKVGSRI
ncbi:MAG: radical SAM protein [Chitinispirillaceae bacterium]|nr:radical SAM protein [Chitinispirillaceae bacterium]